MSFHARGLAPKNQGANLLALDMDSNRIDRARHVVLIGGVRPRNYNVPNMAPLKWLGARWFGR
jgi:hypothetical protein